MAEKMVEEFLLTDDECYKACEDAHLSPFATPYQERAVFLRAQVRKAYPMIDSLAYCRGYNEAKAEARQQACKTIGNYIIDKCYWDENVKAFAVNEQFIENLKQGELPKE